MGKDTFCPKRTWGKASALRPSLESPLGVRVFRSDRSWRLGWWIAANSSQNRVGRKADGGAEAPALQGPIQTGRKC
jgi:hypothetical protein